MPSPQPPAPPPFSRLSRDVVKDFLQTAVVLDDEAFIAPQGAAGPLVEPDPDATTGDTDADGHRAPAHRRRRNSLNAEALITSFAAYGICCAVLTPWEDSDGGDATVNASRRADIVILDWQLGDHGERATRIIRQIADDDNDSGGRLRLIAIYTATRDLDAICDALAARFPAFTRSPRTARSPSLDGDHARILFIRKGRTSDVSHTVSEADLPDRLVNEFAGIRKGLLANAAFGAIAAIRDDTHRLLTRFHSGLDGPFVSHRILLETPDDAEQYAVELLSSELNVLLHDRDVGARFAGREAIRALLSEFTEAAGTLRLMTRSDTDANPRTLSVEEVMRLIDRGPDGLTKADGQPAGRGQKDQLHHRTDLLLAENLETGRAAHREFARLSSRARERALIPAGYRPKLDLGSVVRLNGRYLLCMQPRCDAVRLDGPTPFLFASLQESGSPFDLVVRDGDAGDILLKLDASVSGLRLYTFRPDPAMRTVLASEDRSFADLGGRSFVWICDLRDPIARRFVERTAAGLSRIALDEFEWQRRHARG